MLENFLKNFIDKKRVVLPTLTMSQENKLFNGRYQLIYRPESVSSGTI